MFYNLEDETIQSLVQAFPYASKGHLNAEGKFITASGYPVNALDFFPNRIIVSKNAQGVVAVKWVSTVTENPWKDASTAAVLDEYLIESPNDIAGWVAATKMEMIQTGLNVFLAIFNDRDIMPGGLKVAMELAVQGAKVLFPCGMGINEIADAVVDILEPRVAPEWRHGNNNLILPLQCAGEGFLVGRREYDGDLKWRFSLPVMAGQDIDVRRTAPPQANPERFLLTSMVQEVLGYLHRRDVHQFPPNWK